MGMTADEGFADRMQERRWLRQQVREIQAGGRRLRVPIGVIGPRNATDRQCDAARRLGEGLAELGLAVICGGREGIMEAVAEGAARHRGISIGLLPDTSPDPANPWLTHVIATGIGEARNAIIARAAFCLVAIGDSHGTLSEVALGLQFGKRVFGLAGATTVEGVTILTDADAAIDAVAQLVAAQAAD